MRLISLGTPQAPAIAFRLEKGLARLHSLHGLRGADECTLEAVSGPALVCTGSARYEGAAWDLVEQRANSAAALFVWQAGPLRMETRWSFDRVTRTVSRRDSLTNVSPATQRIGRVFTRVAFDRGEYEVYAQSGHWATESQGAWLPLHAGSVTLFNEEGRTSQNCTPYACLRQRGDSLGLAMHLLPVGNWKMRFICRPQMNGTCFAVVEMGLSDEDLQLPLAAGETYTAPEVWFQALEDGRPESAAPSLHRRWLDHLPIPDRFPEPPLVYNTWLDEFDLLDVERLGHQLEAARTIGAEVFVIDAGWFGASEVPGSWFDQAGDWREKQSAAFRGQMAAFSERVRSKGLRFGLWMEPEHFGPHAPLRQQHPDWFTHGRLNLEIADAFSWLEGEISRLITDYGLSWMKVDFNLGLGSGVGTELHPYYRQWFRLLDGLKIRWPGVFFEGCSSGAMRLDLETLRHFDMHFLSDTTNPVDVLRLAEGTLLRVPPGWLGRWLVLRPAGKTLPDYPSGYLDTCLAPATSGWQPSQVFTTTDLDFSALASLPGVFGLSGDLAGLPPGAQRRLGEHLAFYKQWRRFIRNAHAHLLTPVRPISEQRGWVVTQLCQPDHAGCLLFAYRLQDSRPTFWVRPAELDSGRDYRVSVYPQGQEVLLRGDDINGSGLELRLPRPGSAAVYVLQGT